MNAYERRRKIKELRELTKKNNILYNRLYHVDKIATRYENAVRDATGIQIVVSYSHGWYEAHKTGNKKAITRYREKELITLTNSLLARSHVQENEIERSIGGIQQFGSV